jgi:uncharacterized cupredoxin-like copper-binding protein
MLLRQRLRCALARLGFGLSLAALALVLLPACSSTSRSQAARGVVVRVTERDFRIAVSPARVRAGEVRFLIHNKGPEMHELLVVHWRHGRLPLRPDGFTVDEEAIDRVTVGEQEGQFAGHTHELLVRLKPGRYELFCNMAGHYLGGMRAELVVS